MRVLPECVTTVPPPPPSRPRLRRRPPSPGAGPRCNAPASTSPSARTSSSCSPRARGQLDHLEPELQHRRRQLGELRRRARAAAASGSAVGSRSVTVRRHEAPPTSRAQRASFRGGRPARSGRASRPSTRTPSPRRSVSSWPTASGNSSVSTSGTGGRPRRACTAAVVLASRQAPGAPAVRPQSFGDGAARQPGKLSNRSYSELFELVVALPLEREQGQRQRREELAACGRRRRSAPARAAPRWPPRAPRSAARPPPRAHPRRARPPRAPA